MNGLHRLAYRFNVDGLEKMRMSTNAGMQRRPNAVRGRRPAVLVSKKEWEWETCDCSSDFKSFGESKMCGCGENHCRDRVIHWLGKHWRIECAFDHATMMLKEVYYVHT